ncbi:response regulator [Leptolyngbya sp. NIES-2104]|uniref:response regulator n=1 Tax=Leptolyngbya sp. NIES-2104 TaxID=1552121 RepID=UPI0006EC5033|nr:response regulator [Leptolyngbya sp. NIES-2104]GAP98227.1 two-component response regulator [Leptolyngbya sp. NIES-2104]
MVKSYPSLHPHRLLLRLVHQRLTGCLQVETNLADWSIYFSEGELTFATSSLSPFERLDRHLGRLSQRVPNLGGAMRSQIRSLFDRKPPQSRISPDYQAILRLVEQQYLTIDQAQQLIKEVAQEVLNGFLMLYEGQSEVIERAKFDPYPELCRMELLPLLARNHQPARSSTRQMQFGSQTAVIERPVETLIAVEPRSYKIVCIDDSPSILQAIQTHLDEQFNVVMIADPLKALMQVMRHNPDVILLDVGMPNLDGYELCAMLRRHPRFRATPVIMVTGHTGFIDRARAKLVGASGYLTKPFTRTELLDTIAKYIPIHAI